MKSFTQMWNKFAAGELEDRLLMESSDELLTKLWDDWDCVSTIRIKGTYIPESKLLSELQSRGIDRHI